MPSSGALLNAILTRERMEAFEPQCRKIAANLVQSFLERDEIEFIGEFAREFAAQIQCAFLGSSAEMCELLRLWTLKNQQATLVFLKSSTVSREDE